LKYPFKNGEVIEGIPLEQQYFGSDDKVANTGYGAATHTRSKYVSDHEILSTLIQIWNLKNIDGTIFDKYHSLLDKQSFVNFSDHLLKIL